MQNPSLVVVPYRYKATKLYSEIPITGVGDFTVGRLLNTATRVNSNGNIEVVNANIPRLDYYTTGGVAGCPALLVEPSGSNLAFHSETWASGNNWTLDAVTRVTGSTSAFLAPDGTFTANALSPTSANVFHGLYSNSSTQNTYISGTIYTQSAFFKQGTGVAGRYVQLTYTGGGQFTQNGYANFDLQLGTVAVVSGTSADTNRAARIENYGNGWYRCSFTATCNAAGNGIGVLPVLVNASGNTRAQSFAGVTGDILYGWGAQLETGSVATSYIPTTTGSVTRNADVINVSGAVSGLIGQSEGTIYAEVDMTSQSGVTRTLLTLSDGTITNRIRFRLTTATNLEMERTVSGSVNASLNVTVPASGVSKIALGYNASASGFVIYVNGSSAGTIAAATPTFTNQLTRIDIGSNIGSAPQFNDRIRAVALYTSRLDDADLMVLTSPTYYSNVRDMIWDTFVARTSTFSELPGCLQTRHNELITL
jgi:hypothetical protein